MSDNNYKNVIHWPIVPIRRPAPAPETNLSVFPGELTNYVTDVTRIVHGLPFRDTAYEIAMERKIAVANSRIDGLQEAGDYECANREISYRDGLTEALRAYKRWRNV